MEKFSDVLVQLTNGPKCRLSDQICRKISISDSWEERILSSLPLTMALKIIVLPRVISDRIMRNIRFVYRVHHPMCPWYFLYGKKKFNLLKGRAKLCLKTIPLLQNRVSQVRNFKISKKRDRGNYRNKGGLESLFQNIVSNFRLDQDPKTCKNWMDFT